MFMPWIFISFFFDWMVATADMNRCFSFANFKMFFNVIATFCGNKVDKETHKGSKNNLNSHHKESNIPSSLPISKKDRQSFI